MGLQKNTLLNVWYRDFTYATAILTFWPHMLFFFKRSIRGYFHEFTKSQKFKNDDLDQAHDVAINVLIRPISVTR